MLSRMNVSQSKAFRRSCLSEVNDLMKSFDTLRRSLREYRKFMPETLWVGKDEALRLAADKDCPESPAFAPFAGLVPHDGSSHPGMTSGAVPDTPDLDSPDLGQCPTLPEWGLHCPLCPVPATLMPTCTVV